MYLRHLVHILQLLHHLPHHLLLVNAWARAMERPHAMKIVVIGAGMGGMMSAARLAKAGHEVSLYEASDRVG